MPATALALFGLGLGWNLSFVAATAQLADCSMPWERGKLLGFNDLLSGMTGAGLALLGGYALTAIGVAALAIGGDGAGRAPGDLDRPSRASASRSSRAPPRRTDDLHDLLESALGGRLVRRFSV